jgi:hypothetical protein
MSGSWGIPPNPPNIFDDEDIDDDDVMDEEEKELILEEVEPRLTAELPLPDMSEPPIFMPSIIFFIMSSISRDMPPPPKPESPNPSGMGPPLEEVTVDDDEDDELGSILRISFGRNFRIKFKLKKGRLCTSFVSIFVFNAWIKVLSEIIAKKIRRNRR